MDLEKIRALPTVQDFIQSIETNYKNDFNFEFLENKKYISEIDYGGATKIVFLSDSWDFVFKIAKKEDCSRDYCQLEVKNYQAAKKYNVQKIFLETALFHTCNNDFGLQIYIQPKFDYDCWTFLHEKDGQRKLKRLLNNKDNKNTEKALSNMYDYSRINIYWFARVIQLYGKKFVSSLEKFSQDYQVGDLHLCNIGWKNNKPIIFDYAGYLE